MSLTTILVILAVLVIAGLIIFGLSKQPAIIANLVQGDETKGLLQSKTFWAAAVTLIVAVGGLIGWDIDEVSLNKIIEAGILIFTTIMTIVGRKVAKTPINGLVGRKRIKQE